MNREQIVRLLKEQFEVKPPEELQSFKQERVEQYNQIFGSDFISQYVSPTNNNKIIVDHSEIFHNVINSYFEEIFACNPIIGELRGEFELVTVYTKNEVTRMIEVNNKITIFFDSFLMEYIWMLNKAYLYREFHNREDSYNLHIHIFMHFATLMQPNKFKFVFPKPKTPPHQNREYLNILCNITKVQETFMLAHEIAHHLINHQQQYKDKFSSTRLLDYLLEESDLLWGESQAIKNEVLADDIAFDLVLQIYIQEEQKQEIVEGVSTCIYLFIRYLLWQRIVFNEPENDYEFHLWLSRNSSMRRKIRQAYAEWGEPLFIVDLFDDYLEDVLEPAALFAKERLSEILKMIEKELE